MPVEYRPAFVAEQIGEELIASHHPHLLGVPIQYVFRSKATKSHGRVVLGKARKLTGLNAWLYGDVDDETAVEPAPFFVIELAEDEWAELTHPQRCALVDHELSHCYAEVNDEGDLKLSLRAHDLEEFVGVVRRHGLWKPDVDRFIRAGSLLLIDADEVE